MKKKLFLGALREMQNPALNMFGSFDIIACVKRQRARIEIKYVFALPFKTSTYHPHPQKIIIFFRVCRKVSCLLHSISKCQWSAYSSPDVLSHTPHSHNHLYFSLAKWKKLENWITTYIIALNVIRINSTLWLNNNYVKMLLRAPVTRDLMCPFQLLLVIDLLTASFQKFHSNRPSHRTSLPYAKFGIHLLPGKPQYTHTHTHDSSLPRTRPNRKLYSQMIRSAYCQMKRKWIRTHTPITSYVRIKMKTKTKTRSETKSSDWVRLEFKFRSVRCPINVYLYGWERQRRQRRWHINGSRK